ncbi:MAG: hypothetical protein HOM21_00035, partial [Halobacteriovoraceae bacterium]|nr:hypothetical protein [Halobacteriovoraceae bacterium]
MINLKKLILLTTIISLQVHGVTLDSKGSKFDNRAKKVKFEDVFSKPIPFENKYDADAQLGIYRDKVQVRVPFHLQPFGRDMYERGQLSRSSTIFGKKNPAVNRTSIFGDLRVAAATNEDAKDRKSELNTRLNLDVDYQFTGTERIHAFFRPFDEDGNFTGYTMG